MGIAVVEVLDEHECIDEDALAKAFAERCIAEPNRGYGRAAWLVLNRIASGCSWREAAHQGSCGNGYAMRVAPVGGFFADDLAEATQQAAISAAPSSCKRLN